MRNTNIEILRFVLMVAIFLWHTIVLGFGFVDGQQGMYDFDGNIPVIFFLCSLLAPATYCFVFISGYYGIKFSISKLLNLLLWLIIVAVLCGAYHYWQGQVSWYEVYASFLPLVHNKWWFVTAFVTLFLVAPFINTAIQQLSNKQIVGVLLVLYGILIYRWLLLVPNAGSSFIGLLFVYVLARYMAMNKLSLSKKRASILFIGSLVVTTCIACAAYYGLRDHMNPIYAQRIIFQVYAYCNPLIVVMAVCLFFLAFSFQPRTISWLNTLLKTNLFIYLFSQGVGLFSYKDLARLLCDDPVKYIGLSGLIIMGALLAGHVITFIAFGVVRSAEFLFRKWGVVEKLSMRQ